MNKTELDFSLISCNAFIFCSQLHSIKIDEGKTGRKSGN